MKKALCIIALAAVSLGAVTASPVKMAQDTSMKKMKDTSKMKMKHKKMKMKKKMKDTTGMSKM